MTLPDCDSFRRVSEVPLQPNREWRDVAPVFFLTPRSIVQSRFQLFVDFSRRQSLQSRCIEASPGGAVVLSNVYHPGNDRGVAPADAAGAIWCRERHWFRCAPGILAEISRKFKLPFRDQHEAANPEAGSSPVGQAGAEPWVD